MYTISVWKVTVLGVLSEFTGQRVISRVCHCNLSFLQPLHSFSHGLIHTISFSGDSARSTEKRTMNTEQWINLKCLVVLGKIPSQTLEIFQQVRGDVIMSRKLVFNWNKRFNDGFKKMKDDFRNKRLHQAVLSTSNVTSVGCLFK